MKGWIALGLTLAFVLAGCMQVPAGGESGDTDSSTTSRPPGTASSTTGSPGSSPASSSSSSATATTGPSGAPPFVPDPNGSANATARIWAQPNDAAIRPGASIDDGNCTGNFIFTSLDNATVYIGTAAHCYSKSGNTETDGCLADVEPLGVQSKVQGASQRATLVYSSWSAMQARGASGAVCQNNDFALLQLADEDAAAVSPAMREFGGPTGLARARDVTVFGKILSYGNSGSRPEDSMLSPREGYITLPAGGCDSRVVFPNPAIPGDSGSPVILGNGLAFGDFVSIELTPIPGQGHVCLLEALLAHAADAGFVVQLATWELLDPGLLP